MNELAPLIGPDGVVVAGATWFAGKVAGPSAGAIGDNLKAYFQSRIPSIFGVAEAKARDAQIEIGPIKPGLLTRMVADASFSEDSAEITDWWANLFISASLHGDNKHAVFSDMMAMVGPQEARFLDEFVKNFENGKLPAAFSFAPSSSTNIDLSRENWIFEIIQQSPFTFTRIERLETAMEAGQLPWPIRYTSWNLPVQNEAGTVKWHTKANQWFIENRSSIEILKRLGILQSHRIDVPVLDAPSWINTVEVTHLGIDFYLACTALPAGQK